jgi:hypothetical protein
VKGLLFFRGFAHNSLGMLATVHRLALVRVELLLDGGLCVPHAGVSRELGFAVFANPEHRNVPDSLDNSKFALWHIQSLAHREE